MKGVSSEDFLLQNSSGRRLYHEVARDLPIIDPHNHVDASALAANTSFGNLYRIWIKPDQYKSRAMRNCGIPEDLITGNAPEYDKYKAWASCFLKTAGNPLFHWSCMELKELFGINEVLTPGNEREIWEKANEILAREEFRARNLLRKFKVETLCTTDDLTDSLEHHIALQKTEKEFCLPSLRGDTMISFTTSFFNWLEKLTHLTGERIETLENYKKAIVRRIDFFGSAGCISSDHSLDAGFTFLPTEDDAATGIFRDLLIKKEISPVDQVRLQSNLLAFLGKEYAHRNWKMQLHIGAHRFTSTRLRQIAGAAGGFACIGNTADVQSLCLFLDQLDMEGTLPKTILYTLNPSDNEVFASITGSFSEDGVKGKIQFGPAWWFNDHHEGITQQLTALSHYGLLSLSVGMTTDSRSLLSFLRHDYFRRILCNLIGTWVMEKKIPDDDEFLSGLVADISYFNIKKWLKE